MLEDFDFVNAKEDRAHWEAIGAPLGLKLFGWDNE